jgi:hypothetical protein
VSFALKNPAELIARIGLAPNETLLLVDPPEPLEHLLAEAGAAAGPPESATEKTLRAVKAAFDVVLVWREDRVGSQALLAAAVKRLAPGGALWVVTAMRKVIGPRTPATRRLELRDLEKAFEKTALRMDREVRFSAWHVGYRFRAGKAEVRYST